VSIESQGMVRFSYLADCTAASSLCTVADHSNSGATEQGYEPSEAAGLAALDQASHDSRGRATTMTAEVYR
jgi:hypothetical protein